MDNRQQRVMIETDRHRITGSITMPSGGFRSRLSDFLNHAEKEFIALTEAVVAPLDGDGAVERREFVVVGPLEGNGGVERREFVVVGRQHIVLAMPEDAAVGANGA
jgi:hypothetical protein